MSDSSHQELHRFAQHLGLSRKSFQGDHYDVPGTMRLEAIALGARPVDARDVVRALRAAGLRREPPGRRHRSPA